jgi:GT2 family glycosyltransferase/glycosyltransferase involved in cell wall biosynthesis
MTSPSGSAPEHLRTTVSVILVNYRGADDTIAAIEHLEAVDWPRERLEIVVVENGSGDESLSRLRGLGSRIRLVESADNLGFAAGCNLGVARASGEVVAFLNNDARPDRDWISAAMSRFGDLRVAAVASRVLDWEGKRVDYAGAALAWFGMGYKPHVGQPEPRAAHEARDVLFGTGAAMFVKREVFDRLGGFDPSYFMFYEDVDFGWRLNLLGWRFVYEPASVAFHKHHASIGKLGSHKETYLLERNALATLYKNAGDAVVDRVLAPAILLAVRRAVARGGLDSTEFEIAAARPEGLATAPVPETSTAALYAIDQFVAMLPELRVKRAAIQSTRVVDEVRIRQLSGVTDAPSEPGEYFNDGYENIVTSFDVFGQEAVRRKVLVITGDPIGEKLAGPAIRAMSIARALSDTCEVVLASLTSVVERDEPFRLVALGRDTAHFDQLEAWADVILFQGHAMSVFPKLKNSSKILVADIYDPMHLEQLEQGKNLPATEWKRRVVDATEDLNLQLASADFLVCASDRQRHFYLGQLSALGRVNADNYDLDSDLRTLIDVVPFGIPDEDPVHQRAAIRGVVDGIGPDDRLIIWAGGLYDWFDPHTLIRAVAILRTTRPQVRLFFQGTKHPHPGVPEMAVLSTSRALAEELGVLDKNVFFNDSWVEYDDRQNYLLEADAGVSTHFAHVETTFSFRTRILDYLWARLPIIVTEGDHFADLISREGLGLVVSAEDADGLADAMERVLFDPEFASACIQNIERVRVDYLWSNTLDPLLRFLSSPHHAPDLLSTGRLRRDRNDVYRRPKRAPLGARDARLVLHFLRAEGVRGVLKRIRNRLSR